MNSLIQNKIIMEMQCGLNFSYILSDNNIFLSTEYKVLQSQTNSCFVKCMKMMYNGKIQLYYHTNSLKSFATLIPTLDADSFMMIVTDLLSNIINVKHNGFLSCQNIDFSFERIYVDLSTKKVSLVYLPISKRIYNDNSMFENEVRTGLVKLISGVSALSTFKTMQLSANLSNGSLSIEDVYGKLNGFKDDIPVTQPMVAEHPVSAGILRITALNVPINIELLINKDEYIIGKKTELCDGVINFNPMISRSHCKICRRGTQYTITDLQSANGTFVNNMRLQPNIPKTIKNGDIIRLANTDFQVSIK